MNRFYHLEISITFFEDAIHDGRGCENKFNSQTRWAFPIYAACLIGNMEPHSNPPRASFLMMLLFPSINMFAFSWMANHKHVCRRIYCFTIVDGQGINYKNLWLNGCNIISTICVFELMFLLFLLLLLLLFLYANGMRIQSLNKVNYFRFSRIFFAFERLCSSIDSNINFILWFILSFFC